MNAYSKDLRLKTLAAIERGIPTKEVAELFGVSRSTIKRWLKRRRQTGGVETMKIPGRPSVKGKALQEWLPGQLKPNLDFTLREHCEAYFDERGIEVSEATMSRDTRSWFRSWSSAAPTSESPTGRVRPPRSGTGATSGSNLG